MDGEEQGAECTDKVAGARAAADGEQAPTIEQLQIEVCDLRARCAGLERRSAEDRRQRRAAERMRERVVERLARLRSVTDAVGMETSFFRRQSEAVVGRYAEALAERDAADARQERDWRHRFWNGTAKKDQSPAAAMREEDLRDLRRSVFFDDRWYRAANQDVEALGVDPAEHYLDFGAAEGRDPSAWFSTRQYLVNNPDVAASSANALLHYVRHGHVEGRSPHATPTLAASVMEDMPPRARGFRCVFITGEPESPGRRYRVAHYATAARANGVVTEELRADALHHQLDALADYDVAVFWRVAWSDQVASAIEVLRNTGCTIIFDVDDLMIEPGIATLERVDGIRTQSLTVDGVENHFALVRRTMLAADLCFTTTDELARYMRAQGLVTHVLPNGFDGAMHERSRLERRRWHSHASGAFRIGYAGGSKTHQRDFAMAADAVGRLLRERPDCRLVLFRTTSGPLTDPTEFSALRGLEDRIEWRDARPLEDLPAELARFDVNIAPLEFGNPYCEAKSELKFFEAALVSVPTIASPTGPFRRAIRDGVNGMLAATGDDWYRCLQALLSDRDLRDRIGGEAYRSALASFGPQQRAVRFGAVLDQRRGGGAAARAFAFNAVASGRPAGRPKVYPSTTIFSHDALGAARVTVVIPLYRYEDFIEETLDSVADQTLDCLDLVVVDGGSPDNSLVRATAWAKRNATRFNRLTVLLNDENYGLGLCRNCGIDAAETPYVVLLDADNKLLPSACRDLLDAADQSDAAFVYPTIQHFGGSTALIGDQPYDPQRLAAGNYIDAMALVSKEAWAIVGGVEHIRHGWEDYDFWCRIAEAGLPGHWLKKVSALYRVHGQSMQTVQTTVRDNHRTLLANFKSRHPWVSLIGQEESRVPPPGPASLTEEAARTRLDEILPLLRCPDTGQKLGYDHDEQELRSYDGLRSWPVRNGRPLLSPLVLNIEQHVDEHISNYLSVEAEEIIAQTDDWVLNLSAGGTAVKHAHVVEMEFALFRHTDLAGDAHHLPFADNVFSAVIVLNAFEHYRDPKRVALEIERVLKPGGKLLVSTAFLQPLHEKPFHFYGSTRYGLEEWFSRFDIEAVSVTSNFAPNFTLGWIAAEAEVAVRDNIGENGAQALRNTSLATFIDGYRDPQAREVLPWADLEHLSQSQQEVIAAGFQLQATKASKASIIVR